MARKKKEKVVIERAERLVIEKWNEPKKEDWRILMGKKVFIGQQADGQYYLKVSNCRKRRYPAGSWYPEDRIYEYVTSQGLIKVGDDDVDSIIDSLITLKELIKNNKTVKSTITEVKP